MEFREGIFQIAEDVYRPMSMLNYSSIPHLLQSPAHYIANLTKPRSPSKEMLFGTALHSYVLEPEKFQDQYVVKTLDGRTNKGKQAILEIEFVQKKKIISEEDFEAIRYMDANIKRHAIASKILANGKAEQVMMFKLRASNGNFVQCKAKTDYMLSETVIDLKSTKKSDEFNFSKSIENYNYHIQGAFYSHALETLTGNRPDFIFIAVESEPPYSVNVIKLSEDHYTHGYKKVYEAVDLYERCMRENHWPAYQEKVYESRMSKWLR